MINTSSEYKSRILSNRKFHLYADITLSDSTVLNLTDDDIMQGGMEFEDAVSGDGAFQIGAAIIGKNVLTLNNYDGKFDAYDFTDATVVPYVGLELSATTEKLKKGFYTVDDPNVAGNILTIESLDNMTKFEKDFSGVPITFPITAGLALTAICTYCGVVLSTNDFTNYDFTIQSKPESDTLTCLDMVSYIAQLAGCFARCNVNGDLEIKWYDLTAFETSESNVDGGTFTTVATPYSDGDSVDGGNFIDYASGDTIDGGNFTTLSKYHHLYDFGLTPTVAVDDVVITGIQVSDNAETPNKVMYGTSGYVLSISENPLIQSLADATTIANTIGPKIVGMKFRPFSGSILSDPSIEAGDAVKVSVRTTRGYNTYPSYVTGLSYKVNSRETAKCSAETPSKNTSTSYSALTKAIVEASKNTTLQLTAYDLAVQQMTRVIANGLGVFTTRVTDETGGTIEYIHDKPLMTDSTVRWFTTADGMIEQNQVGGTWVAVSGTDKQGNALYNVLYARKISADIIRTGKIYSDDGSTLIDMAYGVANSDNISMADNIQDGFPLTMRFYIDGKVSKIAEVYLNYDQQKFRTYSTGTANGGEFTVTSKNAGGLAGYISVYQPVSAETSPSDGTLGAHTHTYSFTIDQKVPYPSDIHNHDVPIPSHSHGIQFGIQEQAISDYSFGVYIDGSTTPAVSITNDSANAQGIIDLTAYITTTGWHTIEIRSTTLKRVSARINIKSYIKM